MLDEQGRFDFSGEVLDLAERLWCAYEEAEGRPESRKERLLGLAYIVAALRHDVETIWAALPALPELEGIDLAAALAQECEPPCGAELAKLGAELRRRGWAGDA